MDIQFTIDNHIGHITLNRPQALNALTHEMAIAMYQQLRAWAENPQVKAVIIQGAGDKAFCAGGDIRKIYDARHDPEFKIKQFFWDEYRLNYLIATYPKPYIALLNGITMGGGVGISIHGAYRIATEKFSFAMPETGIGFLPDVGGSYILSRCPGQTGIYLGLTGARIKAADAYYLKLVNYFVPAEQLPNLINALVEEKFTGDAQIIVNTILQKFSADAGTPPLAQHLADIDECFSANNVEEIMEKLNARNNEWCTSTLETLKIKSPTSLKVTLQQLRNGAKLNLDQCLQMEYRMVMRFLRGHDLYEGVRAVIVDKDQKPQWQPAGLEVIKSTDIDKYFAALENIAELNFGN